MEVARDSNSPTSFTNFGDLLKYLRRRRRLTQLELSIAVGYSEAQISRLEKNLRLPDLTALKALFIPALELEEQPEFCTRFLELAQFTRQEDAPTPGIAPYKGLLFFEESDSDLFFGREALTANLAEHVIGLAIDTSTRLLAVVGASGSGKSSLVRAGLAVALKRTGWDTHVFTPGSSPLRMLDAHLRIANNNQAERVLFLVDQFEEIFTLCRDELERIAFIEKLLSLAKQPSQRNTVVIALRADFYSHCAQYPLLRQAVAAEQEYIGQMTVEELRRAIEEPARRGGWEFESGLVAILLQDVGAHGVYEPQPGALPLLSHALLTTWERRRGRMLTLAGYHDSGGVRSAIAETAESVFTDQLNQQQQELARDVFLRLTELGEGTEDTRRRATLNELVRRSVEAAQLRAVLNTLAEARLITLNENSAEVAHEALIREWQRLHEWLTQDRQGLLLHRHLTEASHEWEMRGRDPAELYRGARLAQAREWAETNEEKLNAAEQAFLAISMATEQQDVSEREAQKQRELEAAQKLAEAEKQHAEEHRHTATQLRKRALYLAGAFGLALVMTLIASFFAIRTREAAVTAQANERIAKSRELAAASISNLSVDPERSILLALQAVSVTYSVDQSWTAEAEDALRQALLESRLELTLRGHTGRVEGVAFSPDGTLLATSAHDGLAKVWDLETGREVLGFVTGAKDSNISFSPDGKRLAAPSEQGTAKVWDVINGQELLTLAGHEGWVSGVAFSLDGKRLATASEDRTAKIWDANTGKELLTLHGHTDSVYHLAFSPDGLLLATASIDGTAKLWDAITGAEVCTFLGHTDRINGVAFSPDGRRVATASSDRTAIIWDVTSGKELLVLRGHTDQLAGVAFSPDGARLATTSLDGKAKVWDAFTGEELFTLAGHSSWVVGVAFSPDGNHVATASHDGTAKVWNASLSRELSTIVLPAHMDISLTSQAFSPDGRRLAIGDHNGTLNLWDISNKSTDTALLALHAHTDRINDIAFSPDGTLLATASQDGSVKVWDLNTGKNVINRGDHFGWANSVTFSSNGLLLATTGGDLMTRVWDLTRKTADAIVVLPNSYENVDIAFSPDGTRLAATSEYGAAKIWDVATRQKLFTLSGHTVESGRLSFSPDGTRLATASHDMTARVWDLNTGKALFTLIGHTGWVNDVAFSPDGSRLVTAGEDGSVRVWDVNTGRELFSLHGHTASVLRTAFSSECKNPIALPIVESSNGEQQCRLLTASEDGTIRSYLVRLEDLVALAKSRLSRTLTIEECRQYLHQEQCPSEP